MRKLNGTLVHSMDCKILVFHRNLMRSLGEAGQIEPETEGILIENDVDYSEFSEQALDSLPIKKLPWRIPVSELDNRRDFRDQCVFTIDPATARDLDDALSCEECEDGKSLCHLIKDLNSFAWKFHATPK